MCGEAHHGTHVEVGEQLSGVGSIFPPCGFQGWDSGLHTGLTVPVGFCFCFLIESNTFIGSTPLPPKLMGILLCSLDWSQSIYVADTGLKFLVPFVPGSKVQGYRPMKP